MKVAEKRGDASSMALCRPASNRATLRHCLNKADLDAADVKSYRPITNLCVVSKLLEWLVIQQLATYLTDKRPASGPPVGVSCPSLD